MLVIERYRELQVLLSGATVHTPIYKHEYVGTLILASNWFFVGTESKVRIPKRICIPVRCEVGVIWNPVIKIC